MSVFPTYDEKLSEKFSLVYDYNFSSPLFVHKAAAEIEKNNIDTAIDILSHGIKLFPFYPTAYIYLARALALQTHYEEAIENLRRAAYLSANEDLVLFYKREIEMIKKRRSPFERSKGNTFIENPDAAFNEEVKELEEQVTKKQPTGNKDLNLPRFEPDLAELARRIEGAKLPPLPVADSPDTKSQTIADEPKEFDTGIISETLAKIYFSQGKFHEAISIYEQLVKKEPQNRGTYKQAILEIKSVLAEQKK